MRCRIVSVSEVEEKIAPCFCSARCTVMALVRLPLWAIASPPSDKLGKQRLHVAQARAAGRGIAGVADGARALQPFDDGRLGESVADQADMAFDVELRAVIGDDACRFLAAMLQGVQAERDDRCRILPAEYAEHAAFVVKMIVGLGQQGMRLPSGVLSSENRHIGQRGLRAAITSQSYSATSWWRRRIIRRLVGISSAGASSAGASSAALRRVRFRGPRPPAVGGASAAASRRRRSGVASGSPGDRRFRIEFSGSSGSRLSSVAPIDSSSGRDFALAIQAGGLAPTSQLKNSSPTATTRMPRAAP